jgi:hypothetical protein
MIDRIVHHADVISLKGNSCRLKNTNLPLVRHIRHKTPWPRFQLALMAQFSAGVNIIGRPAVSNKSTQHQQLRSGKRHA